MRAKRLKVRFFNLLDERNGDRFLTQNQKAFPSNIEILLLNNFFKNFVMKKPPQNTIDIDAGTLLLIVSALILVPLLLTGFISH
ncbi:MAG: hypothetical protein AAGK10_08245 [Cyanobacteria bacterium J06555_3]